MSIEVFTPGQLIRITATFRDNAGQAADPSAVFVKVRNPAGSITSYQYGADPEVQKSATGIYYVNVDLDAPGWWAWRWYSTGNYQAALEGRIRVKQSEFD